MFDILIGPVLQGSIIVIAILLFVRVLEKAKRTKEENLRCRKSMKTILMNKRPLTEGKRKSVVKTQKDSRSPIRGPSGPGLVKTSKQSKPFNGGNRMGRFIKKSAIVEAERWFKTGDHSEDKAETFIGSDGKPFQGEGKVVRYFRSPDIDGHSLCSFCGETMHKHGWINSGAGGYAVCPGDWIVKVGPGEFYPWRPDLFEQTYESV